MDIHIDYDTASLTPLCEIMAGYGSDKASVPNKGWNSHNYTTYYYPLFKNLEHEPITLFELGLGTNNVNVPSNMGPEGKPGASLRGWSAFFKKGRVYGADIDKDILFNTDIIRTYYCDQTSSRAIYDLWNTIPSDVQFDIMIDDGLHEFEANMGFFENSFHKLKKGGVYIIEDIWIASLPFFIGKLYEYQKFLNIDFNVVNMLHTSNKVNNCLIAVKKL